MIPGHACSRIVLVAPGQNTGDTIYSTEDGRMWLCGPSIAFMPDGTGELWGRNHGHCIEVVEFHEPPMIEPLEIKPISGHRALPEYQRRQRIHA